MIGDLSCMHRVLTQRIDIVMDIAAVACYCGVQRKQLLYILFGVIICIINM